MDNFHPKVSIVIPVYNGSNFLSQAIDSAIAQTYDNCEIIVVNDGSNDNGATAAVAKSYGNKIRYFEKKNGGVSTALNLAIKNMNGEYFSWLSHDDMYLPEKIESQIKILSELEYKDTVVFGGTKIIDSDGNVLWLENFYNKYPWANFNNPLVAVFYNVISGCSLLISKKHFDKYGLFDEAQKTTQDYDMWFRILRYEYLVYDNNYYTLSRIHPSQQGAVNHNHDANCCKLWISLIDEITDKEKIRDFGSVYNFWVEIFFVFLESDCRYAIMDHIYECFHTYCQENDIKTMLADTLFLYYSSKKNVTNDGYIYSIYERNVSDNSFLFFLFKVFIKFSRIVEKLCGK